VFGESSHLSGLGLRWQSQESGGYNEGFRIGITHAQTFSVDHPQVVVECPALKSILKGEENEC